MASFWGRLDPGVREWDYLRRSDSGCPGQGLPHLTDPPSPQDQSFGGRPQGICEVDVGPGGGGR
jgi:hypothetical protein